MAGQLNRYGNLKCLQWFFQMRAGTGDLYVPGLYTLSHQFPGRETVKCVLLQKSQRRQEQERVQHPEQEQPQHPERGEYRDHNAYIYLQQEEKILATTLLEQTQSRNVYSTKRGCFTVQCVRVPFGNPSSFELWV